MNIFSENIHFHAKNVMNFSLYVFQHFIRPRILVEFCPFILQSTSKNKWPKKISKSPFSNALKEERCLFIINKKWQVSLFKACSIAETTIFSYRLGNKRIPWRKKSGYSETIHSTTPVSWYLYLCYVWTNKVNLSFQLSHSGRFSFFWFHQMHII